MEGLKVEEHEHPLSLIDLQVQYQQQEEEDEEEEEEEVITKEVFHGVTCKRCGEEIHKYHRYYYKCMECDFSLHKFCGELSNMLDHPLHPHPLIVQHMDYDWECKNCHRVHQAGEVGYDCDRCYFPIDVKCGVEGGKNMIHHPSHPHLLLCVSTKPSLSECSACGKEHKGVFYTTCNGFMIHTDCAFLPETLLIQETTNNAFHHTHPLTISYSFPIPDQRAKHYPKCRVCGDGFEETWYLWIYKCDECMYYAHLHCAAAKTEPFMSIFLPPAGGLVKNYKDGDHPHLLHLPFPDETYSLQKHLFFHESETSDYEVNPLTHASHEHPLTLVNCNDQTSSSSSEMIDSSLLLNKCHDPMRKTQFLCNACLRPITSTMPFYTCAHHITCCDFALHEWCTRLPHQIENHPKHPQHPLLLTYPNALPPLFFGVFKCAVCELSCNGFVYCCVECGYYVDVTCALLPKHITHESHPNHLLSLSVVQPESNERCHMCLLYLGGLSFCCKSCDIDIHPWCALLSPKAIRHKYDKHPLHLSYLPIENHKSEYICEICEYSLNPHESFYHCQPCAQSVHSGCAPSILQSETETHSYYYWKSIYYFVNIKFGGIHNNTDAHPHPLSFAQGTVLDGQCSKCDGRLQYEMIFKCLEKCGFVIDYRCCKRLNKI